MYLPTFLLTHACLWERVKRGYRNQGHPTPLPGFFSGPPRPHPQDPKQVLPYAAERVGSQIRSTVPCIVQGGQFMYYDMCIVFARQFDGWTRDVVIYAHHFLGRAREKRGGEGERGPAVLLITSNSRHSPGRWGKISR